MVGQKDEGFAKSIVMVFDAQVNRDRVQSMKPVVQLQTIQIHRLRMRLPGFANQQLGKVSINPPVPLFVGIRQSAAADTFWSSPNGTTCFGALEGTKPNPEGSPGEKVDPN